MTKHLKADPPCISMSPPVPPRVLLNDNDSLPLGTLPVFMFITDVLAIRL